MRPLRFVTLILAALTMGMAFSRVLEMPVKRAYSGPHWLLLQQTLPSDWPQLRLRWEYAHAMRAARLGARRNA